MNFLLQTLAWLCNYGSHIFFYFFAFLLAPIGIAMFATGNRKLKKVFIVLAILTVLLFFISFIPYAFGPA
ncbi:hypothetical protein KGQ34_01650 [Patescibacteria group bacterium]|nr:hypothetical protein [Patescibacteria group bacterium]